MQNNSRIKLMIFALTLLTMACVCSPSAFFERQAENFVENVADGVVEDFQTTLEAGIGLTIEDVQKTAEAIAGDEFKFGEDFETEFPIPDGATNAVVVAGVLNYTSSLPIDELVEYYRNEFSAQGLTERTQSTSIDDGVVNLIFDGHPSGKAIIVQMIDLIVLGVNISVSFGEN